MNQSSFHFPKPSSRWLAVAVCCLPLGNACSDDSAVTTPATFGIEIATLDGAAPDEEIQVRCDQGGPGAASESASAAGAPAALDPVSGAGFFSTLSVAVSVTSSDPAQPFVLRPAHACGVSNRCGFVRIEGLDQDGHVLTSIDTATTEGVLQLNLAQLPSQLRASLIRGVDRKTQENPDLTEVATVVTSRFAAFECAEQPPAAGSAGAGGAGDGSTPAGGAGGSAGDGSTPAGGAGGAGPLPPLAGAGGASGADTGGADAGGADNGGAGGV